MKEDWKKYFEEYDPMWDRFDMLYDKYDGTIPIYLPRKYQFAMVERYEDPITNQKVVNTKTMFRQVYHLVNYDFENNRVMYIFKFRNPHRGKPIDPRPEDLEGREYITWKQMPERMFKRLYACMAEVLGIDKNLAYRQKNNNEREDDPLLQVRSEQYQHKCEKDLTRWRRSAGAKGEREDA